MEIPTRKYLTAYGFINYLLAEFDIQPFDPSDNTTTGIQKGEKIHKLTKVLEELISNDY